MRPPAEGRHTTVRHGNGCIDYGSGISSAKALERAGRETGAEGDVTGDAAALGNADRIVLPGVGAFGDCTAGLRGLPGMVEALERNVREKKPFLVSVSVCS